MLLISVSKRVKNSCITLLNRKITSFCLSLLLIFGLLLTSTSFANETDTLIKDRQNKAFTFFKAKDPTKIVSLLSKNMTALTFKELVILSEAYKWQKKYLKRAQVLEYAKNIYPKKPSIQLELAKSYQEEALSYATTSNFEKVRKINTEKAREIFIKVVDKYPSLTSYKAYLNFLELTPNSPDEIIQVINEGKYNIGESPFFLSKLCLWHSNAGYINEGLKSCKKAIEVKKNDSESHLILAKLLSDTGNKKRARDSFMKTANRFPASANAQFYAAKILNDEGKILESLKHLDLAIENDPPDEALVLRAKLLFNLNKIDESLKAYTLACINHKEPRKPLLKSFKKTFLQIDEKDPLKSKFESELYKCKYVYRPERTKPKGFVLAK